MKFPSSLVKRLRRIDVETRLKGYKYFEIEREFFNKLGVLIDGDFKFGVLYLFLFASLALIQAIYIEMVFLYRVNVSSLFLFHLNPDIS